MPPKSSEELVKNYLRIVEEDDYEGFGDLLADTCTFTLMPTGRTWHGRDQVMSVVLMAGGSRRHDKDFKVNIINWLYDGEYLVVEYEHKAIVRGFHLRIDGYCWVFRINDARFSEIREYINPSSLIMSAALNLLLRAVPFLAKRAASRRQQAVGR